jgi:hypothetical protein
MIIKTTLLHPGWSHSKSDGQYNNESLGSTKAAFSLEKSVKNSKKKEKNDQIFFIYSSNDDQGWTTIEANGSRKPKTKSKEQPIIDSIISSINIEVNTKQNGAPAARIESPARESRYTIPDRIKIMKELEFTLTTDSKQQLKAPVKDDEEEEMKEQDVTKEIKTTQRNKRNISKKNSYNIGTQKDETRSKDGMKDMKDERRNKGNKKTTEQTKQKGDMIIRTTTMATKGSTETGQVQNSIGKEQESNDGDESNEGGDKRANNNNTNNNGEKSNKGNTDGGGGTQKVFIVLPAEMDTYTSTVAWRPEHKAGKDGKS